MFCHQSSNSTLGPILICRGHGTQSFDDDKLVATVCGVLDRVNKLVTVRPLHRRYVPEVGDVVVGRVCEVSKEILTFYLEERLIISV
jgi:exosome complex component RRP4